MFRDNTWRNSVVQYELPKVGTVVLLDVWPIENGERVVEMTLERECQKAELPDMPMLRTLECYNSEINIHENLPSLTRLTTLSHRGAFSPLSHPQLRILSCNGSTLIHLPTLLRLEQLHFTHSDNLTIDTQPQLRILKCSYGHNLRLNLTSCMIYLTELSCDSCDLTELPGPGIMPCIEIIRCGDNEISSIPEYRNLISLDCQRNPISVIHDLPRLSNLNATGCSLVALHSLPSLAYLQVTHNLLTSISGMSLLKVLHCANNCIREITSLPSLQELNCRDNPISVLNVNPSLQVLICPHSLLNGDATSQYPDLRCYIHHT